MRKPRERDIFAANDNWYAVSIICEPGFEDCISAAVFESGFSGLEEHTESGRVILKAYYPASFPLPTPLENLEKALHDLSQTIMKTPGKVLSVEEIPNEDWETAWRAGLEAIEVGSRLIIRPSWITYRSRNDRIEIIIDPKMAFGTGSHATTYFCLDALERLNPEGLSVMDAGCGSGILSIAAVKLGARRVYGFDNDAFSVENALENVQLNSVNDVVIIEHADLTTLEAARYDLVIANMISGVLIPNLPLFRTFLKPRGTIFFSGILEREESRFVESLQKEGFKPFNVTRKDGWIAVHALV